MERIQNKISEKLIMELKNIDIDYFKKSDNKLINHKVFYCNKWNATENKNGLIIKELLQKECDHLKRSFTNHTLIQLNIINAPPDCNTQLFHIDYQGDSASYFIPFVELSDLNGTEYLHFFDNVNYEKYYPLLLNMSDNYLDKTEVIDYLTNKHSLQLHEDFCFKCANADAFSLLYMPYYVYHRGQKNKTNTNRIMLNILFSIGNNFNYPIEEYILDAEIDEEERAERILEIRKKQIIT